jgi:hypothetical protein
VSALEIATRGSLSRSPMHDSDGDPIPVDDAAVLIKWLREEPSREGSFKNFRLQEFIESLPCNDAVESVLARALSSARVDPALLGDYARILGWPHVQDWLVKGRMPQATTCRRGVFGEVLITDFLQAHHEYIIPIWKDRFLVTSGQSQPGLDGLAIKLENRRLKEVCYFEVKLRTKLDRNAAVQGYDQIRAEIDKPIPDLLHFVLARLYEQGSSLFEPLLGYLSEREYAGVDETYRLGLVWERGVWDDSVLRPLDAKMEALGHHSLSVLIIKIAGIIPLTTAVFGRIGVTELVDDV